MNLKNLIVLPVAALCLAACNSPSEKVIERPLTGVRNSRTIEIDKIVLTDTATLMYVDAFFNPGMWIRIDTSAYLYGGGRKYMITGAEGIKLRENHWMPESGEDSFVLFFEPVDRRLKTIDFIEGEPDDYFKIFDIQLKNKRASDKHLASIPKEVRNADYRTATLPEPVYNSAETTVKIHLLGEPERYPMQPQGYMGGLLTSYEDIPEPTGCENGVYTYSLPLYGTTQLILMTAGGSTMILLEPGVENNVWVDLAALSRKTSRYDRDRTGNAAIVYADNSYAAINNINANNDLNEKWFISERYGNEENIAKALDMTSGELAAHMRRAYDDMMADLEKDVELTPMEKDLMRNKIDGSYISDVGQIAYQIDYGRKERLGLGYRDPLPAGVEPMAFTEKDYHTLYDRLDVASMPNAYAVNPAYGCAVLYRTAGDILGLEDTFVGHVAAVQQMIQYVETMDVPEEAQTRFDAIPDPELKGAVELKESLIRKQIEEAKAKTGYYVRETPQAADDKLFDAIVKQYAGKVVVADFWATWCGPCRAAMKNHEPHKDTYLDKDVAFVYITGETSPRKQWEVDIASIRGDHYYLTEKQWRAVCDRFEIRGIPSWVVVTKSGEYVQEELYSASDWEAVINRELAK